MCFHKRKVKQTNKQTKKPLGRNSKIEKQRMWTMEVIPKLQNKMIK